MHWKQLDLLRLSSALLFLPVRPVQDNCMPRSCWLLPPLCAMYAVVQNKCACQGLTRLVTLQHTLSAAGGGRWQQQGMRATTTVLTPGSRIANPRGRRRWLCQRPRLRVRVSRKTTQSFHPWVRWAWVWFRSKLGLGYLPRTACT